MKVDRALINGTIVTAWGRFRCGIGIRAGKIALLSDNPGDFTEGDIIDVKDRFILPGVIDAHVHFHDPGFTHREDFEHGTAACAVGGITTAISHPMNDPPVVDLSSYEINRTAYAGRGIVDYGLHAGGTAENVGEIETLWDETGATAIKMFMCFSVKEFPFVQDDAMFAALETLAKCNGIAIIHAESELLIALQEQRLKSAGRKDPLAYNASRPEMAEIEAIRRAIFLLERTGSAAVIAHVSTYQGLEEIHAARNKGVRVWAETCPHFLTFIREDMVSLGPFLKFSPVMRDETNRLRLWEMLDKGFVHTFGSDHSPFEKSEKEVGLEDIWKAPNGIPGLETLLPVLLDGVNQNRVGLERVVEVTSHNPARLYGLSPRKGSIFPGADADLVVIDMELEKPFTVSESKSKCAWSPYEGRTFKGWPVLTLVRGEVVARDGGVLVSPGYGEYVPRAK
jgi:allantoinase